jgi:DNA-binding CsgD family transcriptional regulator
MATLAPTPRLRGREVELRELGDAFGRLASGHPAIVLVEGEAGIGKTRLLADALDDARSRRLQVVTGQAQELERARPFGVLADAFACAASSPDPRRRAIAALLATSTGDRGPVTVTSDPGLQFQAVDAFVDLADSLALDRPLVVGVDDLQWADPSSLLTLGALGGRLAGAPVALVACLRPSPRAAELERALEALDAAGARRLVLGGLDDRAVVELVAEVVAAEPGRRLLAEVAGAGGNPLFVTELVAALLEEGAIRVAGGCAEVAEMSLPPTLRLTILRRLSFLPDDTLAALRAASVLGSSFPLTELATTTGRSALELSSALAEAIRARVLEDDGGRLRFRHDLLRDAVHEDLPASVRVALHREAGQRLARSGAPALRVAEHLARGAEPGDADAVAWLTRAAREAAPRSPAVAADLLERAIGLADPLAPDRDELLVERAGALMLAGGIAEAEATCRSLLDRDHDPSVEGLARLYLGRAVVAQGRVADGLAELRRMRDAPAVTSGERAVAGGWASIARLSLGDLDGAAATAELARDEAVAAGSHPTASVAVTALGLVKEVRAELAAALRLVDEGMRLAGLDPRREGYRYPLLVGTRGHILIELDRLEEARSALDAGRRSCERHGVRWALPSFQEWLAVERFLAGEWDDALAELAAALELATETGERYSLIHTLGVRSLLALHRGELRAAEEAAARAARELTGGSPRYRSHWATWVQALLLEAGGSDQEALATLGGVWDWCRRSGFALEYPVLGPDLVRLALAAGDPEQARQVAAAVDEVAAGNPAVPWMAGAALRCRGLAEGDPKLLRAAVDTYAQGPRPFELALAAEEAGAAFAGHGDVAAAAPLLRRALATYEGLGAARPAARAEATLRDLGIRRGRRGPRRRPRLGWESLTGTERRVVDLVAEGLTNPQIGERLFVSRRTVQTHLAHVFAKLDISSRAQLAAEVARRRGGPPG